MIVFIAVDEVPEEVENPCYINIYNIDYIIKEEIEGEKRTKIRFKGSNNQINTSISTKELHRRINIALNGMPEEEIIDRFQLVDMEE